MDEDENSLNLVCPTCGAAPGERCQMSNGLPRFASHVDRWDFVKDRVRKSIQETPAARGETAQA
jgi:hypothetical protein